jgi:hypothetical protein
VSAPEQTSAPLARAPVRAAAWLDYGSVFESVCVLTTALCEKTVTVGGTTTRATDRHNHPARIRRFPGRFSKFYIEPLTTC